MASNGSPNYRKLVAFDFDHTVVDDNTDIVVRDLVDKTKISDDVKKLYKHSGWTAYMQEIFHILHANEITKAQMKTAIEQIPEVAGLKDLIQRLHETGFVDVIIISDSNSVFIDYWCKYNGIDEFIKKIYTNHAQFNDENVLKIQPYHHQTECKLSTENLCKGGILEEYVRTELEQKNVIYTKIFYIGDGSNDICPILRLDAGDFGLARKGYRMEKEMDDVLKTGYTKDAAFLIWNDGHDLKKIIFENF